VTPTTVFSPDVGYVEGAPIITLDGKQVSQREFLRVAAPRVGRQDLWNSQQAKYGAGITLVVLGPAAIAAGLIGIVQGSSQADSSAASGGSGEMPWQFYAGLGAVAAGSCIGLTGIFLLLYGVDTATLQDVADKYNAQITGDPGAAREPSPPQQRYSLAPWVLPGAAGMRFALSF
jgi:hypothetical protein